MATKAVGLFAAFALVLAVVAGACGTSGPYPLYPNPKRKRPQAEIALLSGPIGVIDERDVSGKGRVFALLPGCHIVRTATSVGGGDGEVWSGRMPSLTYAFRMRAGYRYRIVLDTQDRASVGQVYVTAWEQDDEGGKLPVGPASQAAIDDCHQWSP